MYETYLFDLNFFIIMRRVCVCHSLVFNCEGRMPPSVKENRILYTCVKLIHYSWVWHLSRYCCCCLSTILFNVYSKDITNEKYIRIFALVKVIFIPVCKIDRKRWKLREEMNESGNERNKPPGVSMTLQKYNLFISHNLRTHNYNTISTAGSLSPVNDL